MRQARRLVPSAQRNGCRAIYFTASEAARSLKDPETFWGEAARGVAFTKPFERVLDRDANHGAGRWFVGGELNLCFNAVDRHVLSGRGDQPALLFDSPLTTQRYTVTYNDLQTLVGETAAVLVNLGVQVGDTVVIYMSNTPQAVAAMLACARIGATHSVVFGGFAAPELAKRLIDCRPRVVVTASWGIEPQRRVPYKQIVDQAITLYEQHQQQQQRQQPAGASRAPRPAVLVDARIGTPVPTMTAGQDFDLTQERARVRSGQLPAPVPVPSTHPLYLLYTSGTTGNPKGVVRDTAGTAVMLTHSMPALYGVDRGDVFFCSSDIGWVVGHHYIVYAPLLRGVTSVLYEGKPVGTPDPGAYFRIMQQYHVNATFTAPTALRAIRAADPEGRWRRKYDTSSMRCLFVAGERSDPPTVEWAGALLGVPVVDNWWQTETGSAITSAPTRGAASASGAPLPSPKVGSAGIGCPGWDVVALPDESAGASSDHASDHSGGSHEAPLSELALRLPLPPGAMTGVWGRPDAMRELYLTERPGFFQTFDAGCIDDEGYVTVLTRTDDVLNVAGHRLSTGEMEAVLAVHPRVAESAVVGVPCGLKGVRPVAVVVLASSGVTAAAAAAADVASELHAPLDALLRGRLGPIASLHSVCVVPRLPKTRSGKVVRKLLRQILTGSPPTPPPTLDDADAVTSELLLALAPSSQLKTPTPEA